jgi:hypothetical protein
MTKKPVKRSEKVVTEIIDRLSAGETMVSICSGEEMPTVRAVNQWCGQDGKLDDRVFRARRRGIMIQGEEAYEVQRAVSNGEVDADPKTLHARITAANAIAHQALAKLSKLDARYRDKTEIAHVGGPMIIGWESDFADTADTVIDMTSERQALPEPESPARGGEVHKTH